MTSNLQEISKIVYRLKRQFGLPIRLLVPETSDRNLQTGKLTCYYTSHYIKRAIVLPGSTARKFIYDLAYISSNRNFTEGGFFDLTTRVVIIDRKDVSVEITNNHHLEFQNARHEIKAIDEAENNRSYLLITQHLTSSSVSAFRGIGSDTLTFSDVSTGEIP